jgi:hypothetical protein
VQVPIATASSDPARLIGPLARRLVDEAFWRSPSGIALFVFASALFYALLDPTFWFDAASLATLVGLVAGLGAVLVVLTASLWFASQRDGVGLVARALPGTLLVAGACVIISRVADFQPGTSTG